MKNQILRWGCLLAGIFILILLAIGGWWFLRPQAGTVEGPPPSPVQVFLLSPTSGDEVSAGDSLPVEVQAFAPESIVSVELFADGKSLGTVTDSPESAWWTWQAWPAGIHTLSAQATAADGQVGQSQTVILTVLEGDGVIQTRAQEGQTLEQVGAGFGVPPDAMANANPHLDPAQPLADGQPVQVPTGGGTGDEGSGAGDIPDGVVIPDLITWQFQPTEAVDKSYCYTSFGNGIWHKMPKQPFDFFSGGGVKYSQYGFNLTGEESIIQAQCWGWLGGTLKYLGEGETQFDIQEPPNELVLVGSGFKLVGIPPVKTMAGELIPPPYALREPSDKEECYQNHGLGALFLCEFLDVQAGQAKDKYVLVWEWQPPQCWPGQTCITKIDGYRVYEIEYTKSVKLLKELNHSGQKVAVVPMGWASCYGVRAYVNDPAIESEMVTWCPGQQPPLKTDTYEPSDVLTVGSHWVWYDDDCGAVAELWPVPGANEAMVGVIEVATDDCGAQYEGTIGVKFPTPSLPQGGILQKAELRFNMDALSYKVYYGDDKWLATNVNWMCPTNLGTAKVDWTGWGGGDNFAFGPPDLDVPSAMEPYTTLPTFAGDQYDVTPLVSQWMKSPQTNQGLVLYLDWNRIYDFHFDEGAEIQECFAFLSGFELDVSYFAP